MQRYSLTVSEDDVMEKEKDEESSLSSFPINFVGQNDLSNNENVLISFYNHLFLTFTNQASIIHQYLLQQDNPYDFINEYNTRVILKLIFVLLS